MNAKSVVTDFYEIKTCLFIFGKKYISVKSCLAMVYFVLFF